MLINSGKWRNKRKTTLIIEFLQIAILGFALCLELVVNGWLFCIFCFSFLVVPNCIVFSSNESIDNINKLPLQMLRKTTLMSAATVNKFVNKADVSKERTCWKARAWNDWHQKQSNKFLTSLPGSEEKSFAKCHGRYQQTFFVHSGLPPFS